MMRLKHPNIVRLYGVVNNTDPVLIVTELATGQIDQIFTKQPHVFEVEVSWIYYTRWTRKPLRREQTFAGTFALGWPIWRGKK